MAVYFPLLLVIYYNPFFAGIRFKNIILLLASLGLYAAAEPVYIVLLLVSILFNYAMVRAEQKTKQKFFGYSAIAVDVVVLLFFKYINQILGMVSHDAFPSVAFPIGLSYFTFREISYIVESRKMTKIVRGGVETSLFLCNFMSVSAGPLGFYDSEIGQYIDRKVNKDLIYAGMKRCAVGLCKKIIIADSLKKLVDVCFARPELSVLMAWCGAIAYTLEIYFDFSGYSDMAVGTGNVFGFELEENFSLPYTASSVSEFWKKWHMSLTKWFTRYVYIPLGGSRVNSKARHLFNLWAVWLCTGIWHGSNWTFILWGMIYFVLQAVEKYTDLPGKINRLHLGHIYTMLVVTLCWVIFRSDSLAVSFRYIGAMFGIRNTGIISVGDMDTLKYYAVPMVIGILCASSLAGKFNRMKENKIFLRAAGNAVMFAVFMAAVVIMIGRGYTAPLYAGF
jgi:D-alanyl-lipoteichoic acid acyltransferase DltB (MBOAT superfamily)